MKHFLHRRTRASAKFAMLSAAYVAMSSTATAQSLSISHVEPNSTQLDPAKGEGLQLRFRLSDSAHVTLQLYDGRDLLVRRIESKSLSAGDHVLGWDLRDHAGRIVPPEAYTYVIEARASSGEVVRYDLTEQTSGETVAARDVKLDAQGVSYVLDKPARVNVRFGLNNGGPLLRTLIDWVVRPSGLQHEKWNGRDNSDVLDLAAHPRLAISVQAFALPENSIIVGAPQEKVRLIESLTASGESRPKGAARAKRMYAHAQQPLEERGDFSVRLVLPQGLPRAASGVPIVSKIMPVRLEVAQADRARALARRFEPVFFVDGQFAFENEVGFVPMTWNFDPSTLNEGEHFLTVNLRGYEGNFGMATVKVLVQR